MNNEYYSAKENNSFKEYKPFISEEYKSPKEIGKTGPEIKRIPESNNALGKGKVKKDKSQFKKSEKEILKNISTSTSTSIAATSGVAAATVAVVATVSVFTGFVAKPPKLNINEITTGSDCVYYSLDANEFDKNTTYSAIISSINLDQKIVKKIDSGFNQNIIGGLKPDRGYNLTIVGENSEEGQIKYLEKKFYTKKSDNLSALIKFEEKKLIDWQPHEEKEDIVQPMAFNNPNDIPLEMEDKRIVDYEIYVSDLLSKGEEYFYEVSTDYGEIVMGDSLNPGSNYCREPLFLEGNLNFNIFALLDGEKVEIGGKKFIDKESANIPPETPPTIETKDIQYTADCIYYSMDILDMSPNMDYRLNLVNAESGEIAKETYLSEGNNNSFIVGLLPDTVYNLKVIGYSRREGDVTYLDKPIKTSPKDEIGAIILGEVDTLSNNDSSSGSSDSSSSGSSDSSSDSSSSGSSDSSSGGLIEERNFYPIIYISDVTNKASDYICNVYRFYDIMEELYLEKGMNTNFNPIYFFGDLNFEVNAIINGEPTIIKKQHFNDDKYPYPDPPFVETISLEAVGDAVQYKINATGIGPNIDCIMMVNCNGKEQEIVLKEGINKGIITNLDPGNYCYLEVVSKYKGEIVEYLLSDGIETLGANELGVLCDFEEYLVSTNNERHLRGDIYLSDVNSLGTNYKAQVIINGTTTIIPLQKGHNHLDDIGKIYGDVDIVFEANVGGQENSFASKTYVDTKANIPDKFGAEFKMGDLNLIRKEPDASGGINLIIPVTLNNTTKDTYFVNIIFKDLATNEQYKGKCTSSGDFVMNLPITVDQVYVSYELIGVFYGKEKVFETVNVGTIKI